MSDSHIIASDAEAVATAKRLAQQFAPDASARDRERRKPVAEMDALSRSGILAITVPRDHGGAGVTARTAARVFQILASGDPAVAQLPHSHFVFLNALLEDGTPEQKQFFLKEVLAGARLGNAQSERGSSSPLDLATRLTVDPTRPGHYLLDGTKHYTTGALFAHWLPVAAIDDDGRLVVAYVPREQEGVDVGDDWNALGQRCTYSGTARFTHVSVSSLQVVDHWQVFQRPSTYHAYARLLHAALDVGIAENALTETLVQMRTRKRPRLGAPVARATEDPLVIHRLGQLHARFHAAEALLLRAADAIDDAGPRPTSGDAASAAILVDEAKALAEDIAMDTTNDLFALLGTSAADESLNLDRHWRNARVHTLHDANQWRYHAAGNWYLNGIAPSKPVRRLQSAAE